MAEGGEDRTFPVLGAATGIPWGLVEAHAAQVQRNHGQTLDALARRGGLDWVELWYALNDQPWRPRVTQTVAGAREAVMDKVREYRQRGR